MARKVYPDDVQARAVLLYLEYGAKEASRRTGVPVGTVSSWASRADVAITRERRINAHVDMLKATAEERRARLADRMLDLAEMATDQAQQLVGDASLRDVVGMWTRAVHDHQLLSGAATTRTEQVAPVEAAHAQIDELIERRTA